MTFLFSQFAFGSSEIETERLIELRQAVESASQELDQLNQRQNSEIEMLLQRKNELEMTFSRDRLKKQVLEQKATMLKQTEISKSGLSKTDLSVLNKWLVGLKTWVQQSIPIHQESRLQKVSELETRIKNQEPAEVLIWDLWYLTEEEIKLTKSNQYELLKLPLQPEVLTEVARIGMLQAYFKTPTQQYGYALKDGKTWTFKVTEVDSEKNAIQKILAVVQEKKSKLRLDFPGLKAEGTL